MKGKLKLNLALFAALAILALIIVLVVIMTKNDGSGTETQPATTAAADTNGVPLPTGGEQPASGNETGDPAATETGEAPTNMESGDFTIFDYFDTTGYFKNTGPVTVHINNAEAAFDLTIGLRSDNDKMLYLNPSTNFTKNGGKIGFYIRSTSGKGMLWTSDQKCRDRYEVLDSETTNYLIDRTYDQLLPASYVNDQNFGLIYITENKEVAHDDLHILVVDLNTRHLLGTAIVEIDLAGDRYQITGIRETGEKDPNVTELLTALMRQEILTSNFLIIAEEMVLKDSILIEKLDGYTYYGTFKVPGRSYMVSEESIEYPIYAVTLNEAGTGFITYYYKPKQYIGDQPISFETIGHDLINVQTQADLAIR